MEHLEHDTGRRRESDRLLGQLRRQLRAELMQEFMLKESGAGKPSTRLPVGMIALDATARTFNAFQDPSAFAAAMRGKTSKGEAVSLGLELVAIPQIVCKPFRLCVDPADAAHVDILEARIGTSPCFLSSVPVPATAFPPLPAWLLDPDSTAVLADLEAVRDAPIENIRPLTCHPGIQVSIRYRYRDPEQLGVADVGGVIARPIPRVPLRAWLLAYVPEGDAAE